MLDTQIRVALRTCCRFCRPIFETNLTLRDSFVSLLPAKKSLRRTALQIALAAATIAIAGRIIQLAAHIPPPLKGGAAGGTATTLVSPKGDTANLDLAALYASCPMAA